MSASANRIPQLLEYVDRNSSRLLELIQDLVQTPSENSPPLGRELACQEKLARYLTEMGWSPELYRLDEVPGLREHPCFWPGRDYRNRPNLGCRVKGSGGGRSLVLSGHIDTVPRGSQAWSDDPFSGRREGNRLYGRGSNDMKGGIGTNLFVLQALQDLGIRLRGDLIFESVVDEEFGGVNGTLAGRLRGYNADAALLSEPTFLRICGAQRGGRTAHITLQSPGGILSEEKSPVGITDQLRWLLNRLPEFSELRRRTCPRETDFAGSPDPVPALVTKIYTGPWGMQEPITVPETCQIEFYWQTVPGETQEEIERQFLGWLAGITGQAPELFPRTPQVHFPLRWMPGSAISRDEPLIRELQASVQLAENRSPEITGLEGPCDMFVFHQFGIPAVCWGARGGNTHAADEYLEVDSVIAAARSLLVFVCRWCGAE